MRLKEIWAMLDMCALGHSVKEKTHHYAVTYQGKTYATLPKGAHGKKEGVADIQIGHIRKMVRHLEIDPDCAARVIPLLAGK